MTPMPVKDLVPAIPSQTASAWWDTPSLASNYPAARSPLLPTNQEPPPFALESPFHSTLHAQLYPEGTVYLQRTGSGHCDLFPHATHHQAASSPQTIDPYLLVGNPNTASNMPRSAVDQPPTTPTRNSSAPVPDPFTNGSTEYTEDIWQFLRMGSDYRYECLWDDGSGRLCGQSGTLAGVKRHLQRDHRSNRCALDY